MIEVPSNLELGGEFIDAPYRMISGQGEAQSKQYKIALGKTGRIWLYSTGDNIYVQGGPNSDGFGGAILEFKLENGCDSVKMKGTWHSNSEALFTDTNVDLQEQHLTFGVIGLERDWNKGQAVIRDLIWFDKEPTYGSFDRVTNLAKKMANDLGKKVCYHKQSIGGSSCGFIEAANEAN